MAEKNDLDRRSTWKLYKNGYPGETAHVFPSNKPELTHCDFTSVKNIVSFIKDIDTFRWGEQAPTHKQQVNIAMQTCIHGVYYRY